MTPQSFYQPQSRMTDPGEYAALYAVLPDDLAALCAVVRGLYVHYMAGSFVGYDIPADRKREVDTRRCDLILKRITELDPRPLTEARPYEQRFVGCCRDASLLLCSTLRHKGIPARLRAGFATYIRSTLPGFNPDHVIVEVHDGTSWHLVDAEQSPSLIAHNNIDFDVLDIPRDRFLTGGVAWQRCQSGEDDPLNYGSEPDDTFWRGFWSIRSRLVDDIAMLRREEHLLWDSWGLKDYAEPTPEQSPLLDHAAMLSANAHDDQHFDAIATLYQDEGFRVPTSVMTYSPVAEPELVKL